MQAKFSFSLADLLSASVTPPATQKPTPARVVSLRNSRRLFCCSKSGLLRKSQEWFAASRWRALATVNIYPEIARGATKKRTFSILMAYGPRLEITEDG